ncbi:MAG: hypothetical protein Kow0090_22670 [Myxococcota bacterium]
MRNSRIFLIVLTILNSGICVGSAFAQEGFEFGEEEVGDEFDFSADEPAAPSPPSAPPSATEEPSEMAFGAEEAVVGGVATAADKKKMQLGLQAIKEKKFMPGAVAMYDVLKTPAVELHQSAEYNLAKSLYKVELYRSSLYYFIKIANAGEGHKNFTGAFQWMLLLARNVGDKYKVIQTLSKFQNVSIPEKLRPEFAFYMAQFHVLRRDYDTARQYIVQVEKNTPFYPKVRFLEATIQFYEAKFEEAVETFKEVIQLTDPDSGEFKDPELRDKAFLVLARIHYAHKQFNAALFYYSKISIESPDWVEVMFEGSWALMQLGRYERSLGNLLTLHSPYFKDYYNPESIILKAVDYYENCRYIDSAKIANDFIANYNAIYEKLTEQLGKLQKPMDFYNFILRSRAHALFSGDETTVFTKIVGLALTDREFRTLNKSIREIDEEIRKIKSLPAFFRSSPLGIHLVKALEEDKNRLKELAGEAAKQAFAKETRVIKDLIGQAYRIRLETTSKIREETMALIRGRKLATAMTRKHFSPAVPEQYEFWPFDGEYWRDELGNYEYVLMRTCR